MYIVVKNAFKWLILEEVMNIIWVNVNLHVHLEIWFIKVILFKYMK